DLWDADFWSQVPHPSCPEGVPLEACNFHVINSINNNDMSAEKSMIYVDSIIGYFAPRAYATLDLETMCAEDPNSVEEVLDANEVNFTLSPNPATDRIALQSATDNPMQDVEVYDLSGRLVQHLPGINVSQAYIVRNNLPNGVYIAKVRFDGGVVTKRVIFE
ncbi:MAG: T9SS type A sorting domain-containing protein, partial [Saprospiraceae bacterium]